MMDGSSTMKADIFFPALAATISAPTSTVLSQALTVVTWPPLPTSPPPDPFDDVRRRQDAKTICGYIDGNPGLPATCSAGSHCVLDSRHGVIGCCPDGVQSCTQGVFTECLDGTNNSRPQTVENPYVFTCTGAEVCYKNMFEGGYSQFGCGTATDLAATVLVSATGIPVAVGWPTVEVNFAQSPGPTTPRIPSIPRPSSSRSSDQLSRPAITSTSSVNTTSTHSSSTISSASETSATVPDAPPAKLNTATRNDEAAIIGGTVGGVAFVAGVVAIAVVFCMLRRRASNKARSRSRPPPMQPREKPMQLAGASFSAIYRRRDSLDSGLLQPPPRPHRKDDAYGVADSPSPPPGSPGSPTSFEPRASPKSHPPPEGYHYPGQYPAVYARTSLTRSAPAPLDGDRMPLTREMDEFFKGFHTALGRIGEEDEDSSSSRNSNRPAANQANSVNGSRQSGGSAYHGDMRPLWQQNRRRSRTSMWV